MTGDRAALLRRWHAGLTGSDPGAGTALGARRRGLVDDRFTRAMDAARGLERDVDRYGHVAGWRSPAWFEVYDVCDGALGESFDFWGEDAGARADAKAAELRDELAAIQAELGAWAVYVLPHYCDRSSDCEPDEAAVRRRLEAGAGECVCASWLTDHAPVYHFEGGGDDGAPG